ncbi:MAG: phosphonate ABC transporter, permease protein PhnE [Oscillospiraceae bacterium]|jgi:phosphonate transport system permease protein|nr:phosphonate ABC transporter, permease protein PhnE [Oscillospiraceae bacterium]
MPKNTPLSEHPRVKSPAAPRLPHVSAALGGAAVVLAAFIYLKINPYDILLAVPRFLRFFAENFLPPDFKNISSYVPLILDTIFFALAGTCVSSLLALVLGLLMSERTNGIRPLRAVIRFAASILRNIPVLVWAALLVCVFGIGKLVGLCALVLGTLGILSRSYAESADEISGEKAEALRSCGASYLQILFHGLIPEFVPSWVNWTLFSFEINIRASVILGMVGAGGIGIMVQTNLRLFKYSEALSLIIILTAMVLLTEFAVNQIRKRVR